MGQPQHDHSLIVPTRARFSVLGFACTLSLITYLDRICIMRARSDIENDLSLSPREMGFVFSAFLLGYALFEVPGGWMGDRWGARRTLVRIVLCWSIFTALTGCVPQWSAALPLPFVGVSLTGSLTLMLLVRFVFGAGEAGAYPNLTRVVSDWFPYRERAFSQGAIWMSARIGGAIAPLVIGRLTYAVGWRGAFWVLGVVGVIWAIFFTRWFRDRPEQHPDCNDAERALIAEGRPPSAGDDGHSWPGVGMLARSATVWAMCCASFCVCFGWYFYPTWQPKFLEESFHFKPDGIQSEILTGLPFLCGAVGSILGGGLSDRLVSLTGSRRWGRSLLGIAGFTGAGLCVLATGYAATWWQAVALLCLAFLINDLAIPVIWAACADIGGRYAGSVSGMMNMVGAFGAILSPIMIPNAEDWLPASYSREMVWRTIFTGLAGAWFLAALAWLFIDASKPLCRREIT